jgi:hypothetical protein
MNHLKPHNLVTRINRKMGSKMGRDLGSSTEVDIQSLPDFLLSQKSTQASRRSRKHTLESTYS